MLLLPSVVTYSQELFLRNFQPGYKIDGKQINTVFETNEGYLVIGVKGALYLFDGLTYNALSFPDSLSTIDVSAISEVQDTLYTGLSNGMILTFKNIRINQPPRLFFQAQQAITAIEVGDNHQLWVSTYGDGIHLFENNNQITHLSSSNTLPDDFVYTLQKDYTGNIWAGTDAGLVQLKQRDDTIDVRVFDMKDGLPDLIVTALSINSENQLWIGFHDGGFCALNIDTKNFLHFQEIDNWSHGVIKSVLWMDQYLWIGTAEKGLHAFHLPSKSLLSWPSSDENFLPQRILELKKSSLRGFWIVNNDRLVWTTGRQIEQTAIIGNQTTKALNAILADRRGYLWFSNENGLFRTKISASKYEGVEKINIDKDHISSFVSCLYEDDDGLIWIGTFDKGIKVLDPLNNRIKSYDETNGLVNNNILSIAGVGNEIWLTTLGGASKAVKENKDDIRFFRFDKDADLGTNYIYHVFIDSKKRVWFATDGQGIRMYENERFSEPQHEALHNKVFYSVTETADGALWFASADEGLFRLMSDSLRHFGLEDGLSSLTITSIVQTMSPYLLVVGYQGFDLVNIYNGEITQVGNRYGIEAKQTGLNALTTDTNNVWYIACNQGILRLENISNLVHRQTLLQVKQLRVNHQLFDFHNTINLAHYQSQISIELAGIWYPNPEEIRLNIELKGTENTSFETRDHVLTFGNLRPGNYHFQISEAGHQQVDKKNVSIDIKILKPFWLRWWFMISTAILALLLFYFWLQQREKKIKQQQRIHQEKLEFEYRNLRNQVNPHFLFNSFSTLIAMIENEGKDAVGYVEKLSDYFRQILQYRDHELITLQEELQLIETYIFLQQKRYGKGLQLILNSNPELHQSKIPPMTLQMLAENALKHNVASRAKPLIINIDWNANGITVKNNLQPKESAEISTGLGLKNISERYNLFARKKIEIETTEQFFIVKLPIIF